jgi:hypothetical protein
MTPNPTFAPSSPPTNIPSNAVNYFSAITYPINKGIGQGLFAPYAPLPEFEFGINGKDQYDYSEFVWNL